MEETDSKKKPKKTKKVVTRRRKSETKKPKTPVYETRKTDPNIKRNYQNKIQLNMSY